MRSSAAAILFCVLAAGPARVTAEDDPLPFSMPTPDGWRTRTIPFPLESLLPRTPNDPYP